jgi:N-acetylglucosamine-6-phosphate deacetylase
MDAFTNAILHTGDEIRHDAAVLVDQGQVAAVVDASGIPEHARRRDLGGAILAPGFIDVQVNGGGGILFNDDPSPGTLARLAAAHRRFGTTGLLPTLISDSRDKRRAARDAVAAALASGIPGILGLHLEGPHLAPARRGVHDARWLAPPDAEDVALMAPLAAGCLVVTLAPESVPHGVIEGLAAAGVRLSAGHSAAGYRETLAALAVGVTGFTHLFNAMPAMTSREPGIAGAALDHAESSCGIIADGHHLHDAAIRLAWRAKRRGRLFLVTDAMPPAGSALSSFTLSAETITVAEGRCVTADGRLAGSALDMATAVRHCVQRVGIALDEALRMASLYPAMFLGLDHRYGRIAAGYAADFVTLDPGLQVRETFIAGCP